MKHRPKLMLVCAWISTIVSLVVLVAWIGSCWSETVWIYRPTRLLYLSTGVLEYKQRLNAGWTPHFICQGRDFKVNFGFEYAATAQEHRTRVPLWVGVLLGGMCTLFFWHRYRRALIASRIGLCPACGYTRAGLPASALCPECSTAPIQG